MNMLAFLLPANPADPETDAIEAFATNIVRGMVPLREDRETTSSVPGRRAKGNAPGKAKSSPGAFAFGNPLLHPFAAGMSARA
jgi:hypothetical protein